MKDEIFYDFTYQEGGVALKRRYMKGEFVGGILIDSFKTAMREFIKYARSMGVSCE